jgi:protein tyrosine/serine phosphatase
MSKKIKYSGLFLVLFSVTYLCNYLYDIHINYNFKEISRNRVYKSGTIPSNKIAEYVQKYQIKSIVDLRMPGTSDKKLNPEKLDKIELEKIAVKKIKGLKYFSNPSAQIPTQSNIDRFLKIMDDPDNYPVLIHCYHGTGLSLIHI